MKNYAFGVLFSFAFLNVLTAQVAQGFVIRTITAGINLTAADDTTTLLEAIQFLKAARRQFETAGYPVQTIRITTQHLYQLRGQLSPDAFLQQLKTVDRIAQREDLVLAMGWLLPPNVYDPQAAPFASDLIGNTETISFTLPISEHDGGIYPESIRCAAGVIRAIAGSSPGGEGNFRFAATANCPPGIPFFPAGYHQGEPSFAIGLESPNLIAEAFADSDWNTARATLKALMEERFRPVEALADRISRMTRWPFNGIDTSPAPGLEESIGKAIETLTGQPFGNPSTLSACAIITDVIKNLDLKTCGYSGLMLPVIEDPILSSRANEKLYSIQYLLLFSAVCGTGLDVVPLPGDTDADVLERILHDVASLSLKYEHKALSARLFLIPGKKEGEEVHFQNPYLTDVRIMPVH